MKNIKIIPWNRKQIEEIILLPEIGNWGSHLITFGWLKFGFYIKLFKTLKISFFNGWKQNPKEFVLLPLIKYKTCSKTLVIGWLYWALQFRIDTVQEILIPQEEDTRG